MSRFRNRPAFERFWRFVYETDGCWFWIGRTNEGYGVWNPERRVELKAHRVSYEMATREEIPAGLDVCHQCDIPNCVRPDHLFLGTAAVNTQDAVRKGRYRRTVATSALSEWLLAKGVSMREFGRRTRTAAPYLSLICSGRVMPGSVVCARIVEATGGAVTLYDLALGARTEAHQ